MDELLATALVERLLLLSDEEYDRIWSLVLDKEDDYSISSKNSKNF